MGEQNKNDIENEDRYIKSGMKTQQLSELKLTKRISDIVLEGMP